MSVRQFETMLSRAKSHDENWGARVVGQQARGARLSLIGLAVMLGGPACGGQDNTAQQAASMGDASQAASMGDANQAASMGDTSSGPSCGDGVCAADEDYWSCRVDCPDCEVHNECGGCETLSHEVAASCGTCGAYACASADTVECVESSSDTDQDTVVDLCDNCPSESNVDQSDYDHDGVGDSCDNCGRQENPDQSSCVDIILYSPSFNPSVLAVGAPQAVVISAGVAHGLPASIDLQEVDANGSVLRTLTTAYDDGVAPDARPGDARYGGEAQLGGEVERFIYVRVRAEFGGRVVYSATEFLTVTEFPTESYDETCPWMLDSRICNEACSDQLLVNFEDRTSHSRIREIVAEQGGVVLSAIFGINVFLVSVPGEGTLESLLSAVQAYSAYAETTGAGLNSALYVPGVYFPDPCIGSYLQQFPETYTAQCDQDHDSVGDCDDLCPLDSEKSVPGACGCGQADIDANDDQVADCCQEGSTVLVAGECGCGVADTDSDGDGSPDCIDQCPDNPSKRVPGICGCGTTDNEC